MENEEILKVKGIKGTFVDSTMEAHIDKETGYLHIDKGFIGLIFSKKQTKELTKWLNKKAQKNHNGRKR